jgi:iron complex outermembrane receptor protein
MVQNILLRETDLFNGVANVLETGFATQDSKDMNQITFKMLHLYKIDNVSVGYTFNQNQIQLL